MIRKTTKGCGKVWLAMCLAAALLGDAGCGPVSLTLGPGPSELPLRDAVVEDPGWLVSDRVAIIDVSGMIHNSGKPGLMGSGENPLSAFHEKLERARHDGRVKAVILRLNTPGGTVTASDAMYREVLRFRAASKKPVVALMMDVAASGGYYLACGSDTIVAYPTTITGSIGVIFQTVSLKTMLDRWGVSAEAITSGPNKDVASPLSTLTPEHRKILRGLVDDFYGRFTAIVRQSRPKIPAEQFATVTDGRVFTGAEARKLGLVDEVGDLYDAWADANRLAGIKQSKLILYYRDTDYHGSAYASSGVGGGPHTTNFNLAQINLDPVGVGDARMAFLYLWRPELP